MAKSLRSKQMRKNRAVKRIRYGEKELKRLNDMVERTKTREEEEAKAEKEAKTLADTEMPPLNDDAKVKEAVVSKNKNKVSDKKSDDNAEDDEVMDVDKKPVIRNKRTLQDDHGQYPKWMSGRRLKQQKKIVKRLKNKKK